MVNILVVSHGNFAKELIKSAEMIAGSAEDISYVSLNPGDTPEVFSKKIEEKIESYGGQDVLILIDIFCGTPYNFTAPQLKKNNVECVTGANLPMLIEAMLFREDANASDLAESLAKVGTDSIKNLRPLLNRLNPK